VDGITVEESCKDKDFHNRVFEGERPKGRATPVEDFRLADEERFIHKFLYLNCGHQGGTRNWGRMGYTNAALLYPDALTHLLGQIEFAKCQSP